MASDSAGKRRIWPFTVARTMSPNATEIRACAALLIAGRGCFQTTTLSAHEDSGRWNVRTARALAFANSEEPV